MYTVYTMYIVYIKITLHIQVLVYCKNVPMSIDDGPTQNLNNLFYKAKKKNTRCQQLQIIIKWDPRSDRFDPVMQGK